ncbi:MAG: hypothetical protein GYB53_18040 [Rhodobacteraceae bacterium]|uniref:hypothetical protein n=1 Tax=Oceanicola sp. S124 TaxID=1042378 RepID=UPI00143C252F|nr:hypothetical protein [Oceanicola sp. S124]MBR9765362.1 hypothetical protein [Paracoccaceae bacterium]MBR9823022.1 hypothetical protein [Paracoccaceae bacterium]
MSLPNRIADSGPVLDYLRELLKAEDDAVQARVRTAIRSVQRALNTDDGRILLELLQKSTEDFYLSPEADPRALDALNAQRFIALDLRRIASNETDQLLAQISQLRAAARAGGRRGTGRG